MINILVTGSKGFIGRNLVQRMLIQSEFKILEFNRSNTKNELIKMVEKSDFIIHLAGEVRPNSSDEDFKLSNISLTKFILNILESSEKSTPILLSSTIHAEFLNNEYGKSKRESERLVEEYNNINNSTCIIYRLPHVFGEGCKVNYNSVISTWIYNRINNLEINVFERNIKMNYVYVQDIVEEFLDVITSNYSNNIFITPKQIYQTTLGEVVDLINEFSLNIKNTEYQVDINTFKGKLFITYQDYYRKLNETN